MALFLVPAHLLPDPAGLELLPGGLQRVGRSHAPEEVEKPCDEAGPAGLVAGPDAGPVVAVEVLVEEDQGAPVRVVLELGRAAVDRPAAARVAQEDAREAPGDLLRNLEERLPVPGAC